jgi:hypothetical protein
VPEPATYVYCLVQSARAPSVKGVPSGIPGAGPARVLPVDRGIWAVVADAPLERFSDEQLQLELQDLEAVSRYALAHAAVIEFFFQKAPVIPLKLFTLFSRDERARVQLAGRGSTVRNLFSKVRGLEEWGVRITAVSRRTPSVAPRRRGPALSAEKPPASGRDYLEIKRQMKDHDGAPSAADRREVRAALAALTKLAANVRKEAFPPPARGRPYVAGASFLVKAQRRAAWKKRISQLAASLGKQEHRLDVSGPWPPYHFTTQQRGTR